VARLSTKGLIVIALVFSLAAAGLVYSFLQNLAAKSARPGLPVVVAKADIAPKTKLTAAMLKVVNMPAEYIQPGAVQDIDKAVGVAAKEQIAAGEQVIQRRLVIEGKSAGFPGIIPPGKRAVAVAVTEVTGVAGLVKPGDSVDVIVTFEPNVAGEHLSQIVLQNLRVLAANQDTEAGTVDGAKKEGATKMTVTLAVSPDEATRLAVADEKGKIRLALRPYLAGDGGKMVTGAVRPRDIVDVPAPPAAPAATGGPPAAPARGIEVIRGTKTERVPVN
jgi:pilus assembly protein CpaB